ncbi:hypothetical protein Tco_1327787 [Tanacetum coccineum]
MANLSEDIQCGGSDTRPPMLDRTDFASWQQRIRLYCQGKENGVNILKSINEVPFQMGYIRDPIAKGTEGAQQLEEPFTHKEEMDLETAQTTTTAKFPILKQGAKISNRSATAIALLTEWEEGVLQSVTEEPKERLVLLEGFKAVQILGVAWYKNLLKKGVFVFIQEMITSQLQGEALLYDDVRHALWLKRSSQRWSVSTATRWDTLQGNAEDLGTKIAGTGIKTALEGLYMADDEVPTNMTLMTFLDSELHNDKTCSKTCLKSFETLKTQLDDLKIEFNKSEFNLATYKRGLASPEFEGYGPKNSKSVSEDISNEFRESPDAPLIEKLVSDDKLEKKTIFSIVAKIEFVRPNVRY